MRKSFLTIEQAGVLAQYRNVKFTTGLIVAGAISAAAGIASTAINADAQSSANELNKLLAEETNQQQADLFREGNQFNAEQAEIARNFNAEESEKARSFEAGQLDKVIQEYKDYNSASAQYQRFLDAGLNPASLGGNLQNGQGFSIPSGHAASGVAASAASTPTLHTPQMQAVQYGNLANVVGDAINTSLSLGKGKEEIKGMVTENQFKEMTIQKGLDLSDSEIKKNYAMAENLNSESNLAQQKINESAAIVRNLDSKTGLQDVETQIANMKKLYANDFFKYQAKQLEEQYNFTKGQADTIVKYTYAQIASAYGSAAQSYAMAEYYQAMKDLPAAERAQILAATDFMETQNSRERYSLFLDRQFGWKERMWGLKGTQEGVFGKEYQNSNTYRIIQGVKDTAVGVGAAVGTAYGVTKGMQGIRGNVQGNYIYGNPRFNMQGSYQY